MIDLHSQWVVSQYRISLSDLQQAQIGPFHLPTITPPSLSFSFDFLSRLFVGRFCNIGGDRCRRGGRNCETFHS